MSGKQASVNNTNNGSIQFLIYLHADSTSQWPITDKITILTNPLIRVACYNSSLPQAHSQMHNKYKTIGNGQKKK